MLDDGDEVRLRVVKESIMLFELIDCVVWCGVVREVVNYEV
jgi:hypothetical protein